MLDPQKLISICEQALEYSPAEATEVIVGGGEEALTRYANSQIHQNVWEQDVSVSIRALEGQRSAVAGTNDYSAAGLRETTERAAALARMAPEDPSRPGLVKSPSPQPSPEPATSTREATPERRGEMVQQVLAVAGEEELEASGALQTSFTHLAVANSAGTLAHSSHTRAQMTVLMGGEDSSGWAEAHNTDLDRIDPEVLARRARDKAVQSRQPRAVEPGTYAVVLEPLAVADMLTFLAMYGFNALAFQEKRSFLSEKLGQQVCAESVNLVDDGNDPRGLPLTFDFEGVPKQRMELIRAGTAVGMVHDRRTAERAGGETQSTGHALPPPNPWGPIPLNMFLEPGESAVEEMVRSMERGLVVTRFHYTNMLFPVQTVLTGMTRDGTFLVEEGQVVGGVKNLRFTQSILEALGRVVALGREGVQCEYVWAPAVQVDGFTFSGATEF